MLKKKHTEKTEIKKNYRAVKKKKNGPNVTIPHHQSVFMICVSRLNYSPVKGHRAPDWIEKQDMTICFVHETHFGLKNT